VFDDDQRERLIETLVGQYSALKYEHVRERFLWYWHCIDHATGERIKAQVSKPVVV
jgi:catalase